jgi:Uncharacterized protein conserved in bacteria (DUF2062)
MLEKEDTMKNAWPYRKIFLPIVDLLRQGVTPEKIALSIALGAVLGIFPVLGSTTILCAAAAFVLRLNLPAIQAVNFLVYPLQLILFLPFLQAGSRITGAAPVTLSMKEVFGMIKSDPCGPKARSPQHFDQTPRLRRSRPIAVAKKRSHPWRERRARRRCLTHRVPGR